MSKFDGTEFEGTRGVFGQEHGSPLSFFGAPFYGTSGNDNIVFPLGHTGPLSGFPQLPDSFHNHRFTSVNGRGGDDTIDTSWEYRNINLHGGSGNDSIKSGIGNDHIYGNADNDYLDGHWGNDRIDGGFGDDTLIGSWGNDTLLGNYGDDHLSVSSSSGRDYLEGGRGNDTLIGGYGRTTMNGGYDNDSLQGGSGENIMNGGYGDDTLTSNNLSTYNTLNGGYGDDLLIGDPGIGTDLFKFVPGFSFPLHPFHLPLIPLFGDDSIQGFNPNFGDRIDVSGLTSSIPRNYRITWEDIQDGSVDGPGGVTIDLRYYQNYFRGSIFIEDVYLDPEAQGLPHAIKLAPEHFVGLDPPILTLPIFERDPLLPCRDREIIGTDNAETIIQRNNCGDDTISGKGGADVFVFEGRHGDDRITDFVRGEDKIDLSDYGLTFSQVDTVMTHSFRPDGIHLDLSLHGGGTIDVLGSAYNRLKASDFIGLLEDPPEAPPTPDPNVGDNIPGTSGADTLTGTDLNDTLNGGTGDDTLDGGAGNDAVLGAAGNDSVSGGAGNDAILGFEGMDTLSGGADQDTLWGMDDNDSISGGEGHDLLHGGDGADTLNGGTGSDNLLGNDGADSLSGGDGSDGLWGEAGADTLSGDDGADFVSGGMGNDSLSGDDGADYLAGGEGSDTLEGGTGYDVLAGGDGDDTLNGGPEGDTFFGQGGTDTFVIRGGVNWIMDFDSSDRIDLGMTLAQLQSASEQLGEHLHIHLPGGGEVNIAFTTIGDLGADNLVV